MTAGTDAWVHAVGRAGLGGSSGTPTANQRERVWWS